jgi:glycosyltransferase involved in cell wall biosynthesis
MTSPEAERRKPRLLVVTSTYPRWAGDSEPGFVHGLVRGLLPFFEIVVLCPNAPGAVPSEVMDGAHVVRYRYAPARLETLVNDGGILGNLRRSRWKWLLVPGFLASQWVMLRRLRRSWKPDAIHAHWILPQGLVAALGLSFARVRVPLVVTSHGTDLNSLRARPLLALKRFTARRAAAITVVSEGMRKELRRLGVGEEKSSVLPMGVDLASLFTPDDDVARASDDLLFVGRLVETKGLRHLVAAMPAVLAVRPNARLVVVGSGPELDARRKPAIALGVADKIRFEGALPQSGLPALYRRASMLVAPFEEAPSGAREGLGLVMVEAVGCGCPVVTTSQPAVADVFGDTGPAGLAEPGSAQSLASEIVRVLSEPAVACQVTADVRPRIVERFGMESVARRYAVLLSEVACAAKPA